MRIRDDNPILQTPGVPSLDFFELLSEWERVNNRATTDCSLIDMTTTARYISQSARE